MAKIANMMTRIVSIGKLEEYKFQTTPFAIGKGVLQVGDQKIRFTLFNNENGSNPHTKAEDFEKEFKKGDKVFLTGSDNRSYSEEKDQYYEDIQVWDYRTAEEDEKSRYVFVYVGDVKEINDKEVVLSFINYKEKEMLFHLNMEKAKGDEYNVGDRIKVKGEFFIGLKMDYFGDGEFVTERNVVEVKLLNTADEIEADKEETPADDSGMWD